MNRLWHALAGHCWELEHGTLSKQEIGYLKEVKFVTHTEWHGETLHLYGWKCSCGASKPATAQEVLSLRERVSVR